MTAPSNLILRGFAQADHDAYARLMEDVEPVVLQQGDMLGRHDHTAGAVYFVESGVVSAVAVSTRGESVEIAVIGREGCAGLPDALGPDNLSCDLIVQIGGLAYRAPRQMIRAHLDRCTALQQLLMAYAQTLVREIGLSALCNRFHSSEERLARWLVLISDRAGTNRFALTHEFIAQMVGAPRSAVTQAAASLRRRKLISYRRGLVIVQNSERLRRAACDCLDAIARQPSSISDTVGANH